MVEQCHYQVIPFVKGASSRVVVDVGESRGVVVAGVGDARWPPKWPQSILVGGLQPLQHCRCWFDFNWITE